MSKFADQLRALRIFNNWDLLRRFGAPGDVAVEYCVPDARSVRCQRTRVWSTRPWDGLEKDPGGSFSKEFLGKRAESWPSAVSWAEDTIDRELAPSPHGGYLTRRVVDKAREAVRGH